jgi:DNA-binding MarR family transcriptional regulator
MRRDERTGGSRLDQSAERVLSASRALVGVAARSLAKLESDLTLPQYRALVLLCARGELNARSLAEALEIKPSTLTALCDRLEAKGLITRTPSSQSRREVVVRASSRGRALVDNVSERRRREISRILEQLDAPTRRAVSDAFAAFAAAAGELPDDAWKLGWT